MGVVAVVTVTIGVLRTNLMSGVAGKIVRHVMAKINAMLAAQADKREHELADQDRAADDGAEQKEDTHCQAL